MPDVTETHLSAARLSRRGKVRDLYDVGEALLLVASDRISAFDCVLSPGVPDKGRILTQLSNFWFAKFPEIENHLLETDMERFPEELHSEKEVLAGRAVLVRKTEVVPFECVARGYIAGSGWAEYRKTGEVCGIRLPRGLAEAERLSEPIFTPATKNDRGHDENVPFSRMANDIGSDEAEWLRVTTLALYERARDYAESRGILLADTKLEFGRADGKLIWIDEAFTPDSSRFWPLDTYQPGKSQPSLDKQIVRDHLLAAGWNQVPPAPNLPPAIIERTSQCYLDVYQRLTGTPLTI